jgi:hypothetical protein
MLLRRLAGRVREIADLPEMEMRKQRIARMNALTPERPLVLCGPEGSWPELVTEQSLVCCDPLLREWERALRQKLFWWEGIHDDNFLQPWFDIRWAIKAGNYGFDIPYRQGEERGSYVWDAPMKDLSRDFEKLRHRRFEVDRAETHRRVALANELFGDLLPVRIHGQFWWTMGLTWEAVKLVGLENLMLYMCDEPDNVHRLMSFLRDDHLALITWAEREGLLRINTAGGFVGSGGVGYMGQTPPLDSPCRLEDIWGFAESQETVGISPAMFEEFVMPYQKPLLEKFGLNYYGCCEGLENRIDIVLKNVPRLRRVSVAPKANQDILAGKLAGRYVYCRKADPVPVCVGFNEDAIRRDIRHTLAVTGGQPLELILKDTHTVQNKPHRIKRWVEIALEMVQARN